MKITEIENPKRGGERGGGRRHNKLSGGIRKGLGFVLVLLIIWVFPGWLLWQNVEENLKVDKATADSSFWVCGVIGRCGAEKSWRLGTVVRVSGRVSKVRELVMVVDDGWWQSGSKSYVRVGEFLMEDGRMGEFGRGERVEIVSKVAGEVIVGGEKRYILEYPSKLVIWENSGGIFQLFEEILLWFTQVREKFTRVLVEYLPEPHGGLLIGILLGVKANMPNEFYNDLVATGTLHVIAASGFNISIIAGVMMALSSRLFSRHLAIVVALLGIGAYTILAGMSASVVRAAIMGSLSYTAMYLGRDYWAKWALVVTGGVMLVASPGLIDDVGFWLSVAATGGILWLSDDIASGVDKFGEGVMKWQFMNQFWNKNVAKLSWVESVVQIFKIDLVTSLAAQVATWPIILAVFGRVSLVSPLVNIMVLWLIPPVMGIGMLKLGAVVFGEWYSYVIALWVYPLLSMFVIIVEWWGKLDWAGIDMGKDRFNEIFLVAGLVAYYGVLVLRVWLRKR